MKTSDMPEVFYGACGVEGCTECWPLYDQNNIPIPGTEEGVSS